MKYNKENAEKYFTQDYPHLTMLIAQVGGLKASEMLGVSNIYTAIRTNRVRKTHELAAKGLIDELTNPNEPIKGRTPQFIKDAKVEHNFGKKPTKDGYKKPPTIKPTAVDDVKANHEQLAKNYIAKRLGEKYKVTQHETDNTAQEKTEQLAAEDTPNEIKADVQVKSVNEGVENPPANPLETAVKNIVTNNPTDRSWIVIVDTPFRNDTNESLIKHVARTNDLIIVAKASCYIAFRGTRENSLKFRQVLSDASIITSVFLA